MKNLKILLILALVASFCMPATAQKSTKKAKKELMSTMDKMDEKQQMMVLKYARNMEKVDTKKAVAKTLKKMSAEDRQKLLDYATRLQAQKVKVKPAKPNKGYKKINMKDGMAQKKDNKPTATATAPVTKIEVVKAEYDFGVIMQGEKAQHIYKIKNVGNAPLVISKAKGSCGCTVPKWPKDPIPPGEIAEIDVVFNSRGKRGKQAKRITITANTAPAQTFLTIKGEVKMPEKKTPAPVKEKQ